MSYFDKLLEDLAKESFDAFVKTRNYFYVLGAYALHLAAGIARRCQATVRTSQCGSLAGLFSTGKREFEKRHFGFVPKWPVV